MEEEISPQELEHLKELARKIKAGEKLGEVTVTFQDDDGIAEQLLITNPAMLELLEKAVLAVWEKHCKE